MLLLSDLCASLLHGRLARLELFDCAHPFHAAEPEADFAADRAGEIVRILPRA
jgi:hypothetical protein